MPELIWGQVGFCLHISSWQFETCISLIMDKAPLPNVSESFSYTSTECFGEDVSSKKVSEGRTFPAARVMEENAMFGFFPTTSGTLAVLKRLETPLSAVSE